MILPTDPAIFNAFMTALITILTAAIVRRRVRQLTDHAELMERVCREVKREMEAAGRQLEEERAAMEVRPLPRPVLIGTVGRAGEVRVEVLTPPTAKEKERAMQEHAMREARREVDCACNGEPYVWIPFGWSIETDPMAHVRPIDCIVERK